MHASGLIIRDSSMVNSSWRSERSFGDFLRQGDTVAIADIDTRKLTRIIREKGAQSGCIMTGECQTRRRRSRTRANFPASPAWTWPSLSPRMSPTNGVTGTTFGRQRPHSESPHRAVSRGGLRLWHQTQYPAPAVRPRLPHDRRAGDDAVPKRSWRCRPDGIFLSNGPGDPEPCDYAIKAIQEFLQAEYSDVRHLPRPPVAGPGRRCEDQKMKFGHHGANHPVQDLATGQVMITSQNHGFAVDESRLCLTTWKRRIARLLTAGCRESPLHGPGFQLPGAPGGQPRAARSAAAVRALPGRHGSGRSAARSGRCFQLNKHEKQYTYTIF